jgi:hypothetical protein
MWTCYEGYMTRAWSFKKSTTPYDGFINDNVGEIGFL